MSDMERLTIDGYIASAKNIAKEQRYYANFEKGMMHNVCITNAENNEQLAEWLEELQRYRDLAEQGRLIVLPCKVGDVVYFPIYDYHNSAIITKIEVNEDGITFYWAQYEIGVDITELWDDGYFSVDEIGKTVFLTEAEAEAKLKELEG